MERFYPIGTPGEPWTDVEKREWFDARTIERSYADEVLRPLAALGDGGVDGAEVFRYGALPLDLDRYPLHAVRIPATSPGRPWALITGGVHGYETSGVQGALRFLATATEPYRDRLNLLVAPCVSPWGYEVINRWNPNCIDPNRSFYADSPAEESAALMGLLGELNLDVLVHMDLHETTDSDEYEFRPAQAARDGAKFEPGLIPDGFYTVGDTANPQPEFQAAVIAGVEAVTHIAPADDAGQIIGSDVTQRGVINYPNRELGLCAGITDATFTTTTEVYPDSPSASPERCIEAQVAAVRAGLDHALASR
jgi:hypothetical protein